MSILIFSLLTFYFLDFREVLPHGFHWLGHIQLIPALISANIIVLVVLIVLTLLFGRIYCSSICPMGVFQDIVSWISKCTAKKKKRYRFSKAKNILRWSVFGVTLIAFFAGFPVLLGLIDPYSAYGRMITNVFKPVYMAGNNLLESIFTSFGNYTFYKVEIGILSVFSLVVGILTFLIIGYLAWRYGRTFCNTICPVGTLLGFLSKFSLFKVRIDDTKCNGCGLCAMKCKASCIDSKNHMVDYSRCVDCFNCLGSCKQGALAFKPYKKKESKENIEKEPTDKSKRQFLITGLATAVTVPTVMAQDKTNSLLGGKVYKRQTPISPPGSLSAKHLLHHCTSCHLCVSKFPANVLKQAFMDSGFGGMIQPMMYFE